MYSFFIEYNILNNSLFEFREGHSTTLVLSEFVEGVLSKFDKGEGVCAILLVLSKFFYCVERSVLLKIRALRYKRKPVFIAKIISE